MDEAGRAGAERAAEWACASVATRFFHELDRNNYAGLARLLAPDGRWIRQGTELAGPEAVLRALEARPAERTTRHILANVVADVVAAEGRATVGYDLLVYTGGGTAPPHLSSILSGTDELVERDGRWLILLKRASPVFRFAAPAAPHAA